MWRDTSATRERALLLAAIFVCSATMAQAQTLPSPWLNRDIGTPALAGGAAHNSGVFSIDGAGTGIAKTSDQFQFVYQQVSGDLEIVARVDGLTATGVGRAAALMIRASLYANAAHASALVTAAGSSAVIRATGGKNTSVQGTVAGAAPVWLRATRVGNVVTAYRSSNGSTWTTLSSGTVALGNSAYVGLAVTSGDAGTRTTATISNVRVTKLTLPNGQQAVDIGNPAITGSTTFSAGKYTIQGAGSDIWSAADQFRFVYQPVTGDVDIIARVISIANTNAWAKAGVMIRESLTAESRHASMFTSVGKGYAFQRRLDPAALSVHTSGGAGAPPGWVRLVRRGDTFDAYRSADGTGWTKVGSETIAMTDTVYVGLAVTSHNTANATTAAIDGLTVAAVASANRAPAVSLTAPASGTQVVTGTGVTLTASASDPENRLLSVDFYAGSTLIARDTASPYSVAWTPTAAGTYLLTAVAHDADGASTTSGGVTLTVAAPPPPATVPRTIVFTASIDHATITSYLLEVFAAGANPSTATPVSSSDLGKPAPALNNDISVDRSAFFSALPTGSYLATVTSVAPGGRTRSAPISFTR